MSHRFFRENPLISIQKYDMMALESAPSVKRAARAAYRMKSKALHLMIITQKKPLAEVLAMVGDAKTVAVIGCGLCASTCQTGGAPEVEAMKKTLEEAGKSVVVTDVADACCMKLGVRAKCKAISTAAPDCIVCMSCGDGVQTIAKNCTGIPVYPANNTMFLGEVARVGIWEEACKMCGDCVLGTTGGICPITQCAKSLLNGPCGGQKNGKCEVNPENDCAWIQIYKRLEQLGQLDKLSMTRPDKGYEKVAYTRTINQRGKKA